MYKRVREREGRGPLGAHRGWSNARKREGDRGRKRAVKGKRERKRDRDRGRESGNERVGTRGSGLCFAERGINRGSLAPTDTIGTF